MEGIINFWPVEIGDRRIGLAERRRAQIHKGSLQPGTAETTRLGCRELRRLCTEHHGSHYVLQPSSKGARIAQKTVLIILGVALALAQS